MKKDYNRKHYFRKQKALGFILIWIGIITAVLDGGDITSLLLLGPIGLYVICTKQMLITDRYYRAVKHSEKMRNRRP